jgi:putative transposase
MRKTIFAAEEFYHVYNRGTEKRNIFSEENDYARFLESMSEFNSLEPIGSLFENSFRKKHQLGGSTSKDQATDKRLVNIVAYCLNPNHYHLLLQQVADKGIEKFMQRMGTGYTMYFNNKYERTGLFQGRFKAVHIENNDQLSAHTSTSIFACTQWSGHCMHQVELG